MTERYSIFDKRDHLVKEFCELCKLDGYGDFKQKISLFFNKNGFTDDEIGPLDIEFKIIEEIFSNTDNLDDQLDFIEKNIDKKDRAVFIGFYIEEYQQEMVANFFQKLTSWEKLKRFNEVFGVELHKTGLQIDFPSEVAVQLYDNILKKIADPAGHDLEDFIITCYEENFTKIEEDPDDNTLIDVMYEMEFAAPHIMKNFDWEYLKKTSHIYDYLTEYFDIKTNKNSPSL